MKKFVCISDIHLVGDNPEGRLDDLVITQFNKLKWIFDFAKKHNADIIQAGDFTDKPRNWKLLSQILSLLNKYEINIYLVRGQHDSYFRNPESNSSTIQGILRKTGKVKILSNRKAFDYDGLVKIYGVSWGEDLPKNVDPSMFNILVIHDTIADSPLFSGHKYKDAMRFLKEHKEYKVIVCGDIHRAFLLSHKNRYIINTGCILRKTVEKYNYIYSPHVYLLGIDNKNIKIDKFEIPYDEASQVLSKDSTELKKTIDIMLDDFIDEVGKELELGGVRFEDNLQQYIKINNIDQSIIDTIFEYQRG